jgi:hypothetical protein
MNMCKWSENRTSHILLSKGEWSASHSGRFTTVAIEEKASVSQSQSDCGDEETIL